VNRYGPFPAAVDAEHEICRQGLRRNFQRVQLTLVFEDRDGQGFVLAGNDAACHVGSGNLECRGVARGRLAPEILDPDPRGGEQVLVRLVGKRLDVVRASDCQSRVRPEDALPGDRQEPRRRMSLDQLRVSGALD